MQRGVHDEKSHKKAKKTKSNEKAGNPRRAIAMDMAKGLLGALIFTVAAILLFAFLIKAFNMQDGAISAVNQLTKIFSILIAGFFAARETGWEWLKGAMAGLLYVVCGFLLFSLIEGSMGLWPVLLSDMGAGAAIGLVAGLLRKHLRANTAAAKRVG